jgi:hypothetical protein
VRCWAEPGGTPPFFSNMTVKCTLAMPAPDSHIKSISVGLRVGERQLGPTPTSSPTGAVFPPTEATTGTLDVTVAIDSNDPFLASAGDAWNASSPISPATTQNNPIAFRKPSFSTWRVTLQAPASDLEDYHVVLAPYDVSIAPFATEKGESVLHLSLVSLASGQSTSLLVPEPPPRSLPGTMTYEKQGPNFTDPVETHDSAIALDGQGVYAVDVSGLHHVDGGAP